MPYFQLPIESLTKNSIAPMIKVPLNIGRLENFNPQQLFCNFENAWSALNQPPVLFFIYQQVNIVAATKNVELRFLLQENARDLFNQTIYMISKKLRKGGLVFENFDSATETSAQSWFRTVARNAANDALKLKQPKHQKVRFDKGFDQPDQQPFILETATLGPSHTLERKEFRHLQNWLKNLPLLIANSPQNGISPTKILIWKLYDYPEQVTLMELKKMNARNLRAPEEIYYLLQHHMKEYIQIKDQDDAKGTHRKNFLVWLLFGSSYSSYQDMLLNCEQKWLSRVRDNQIRKTYGRATSDIWTLILFRLLSSKMIEGYESWFKKAIHVAFLESSNNFHSSRKGIFIGKTNHTLKNWCATNLSCVTLPKFSRLQDLFAVFYSVSDNRHDWIASQSHHQIDKITQQFRVAKKIIPAPPFQAVYSRKCLLVFI